MVRVIGNKTPKANLTGDATLNNSSVADGGGVEGNTNSSFTTKFRSTPQGTVFATAVIGSAKTGDKIVIVQTYYSPSAWEIKRNGSVVFSGTGNGLDKDINLVGSELSVDTIPSDGSYTYTLVGTGNPGTPRSQQLQAVNISVTDTHAAIGSKSKGTVILN